MTDDEFYIKKIKAAKADDRLIYVLMSPQEWDWATRYIVVCWHDLKKLWAIWVVPNAIYPDNASLWSDGSLYKWLSENLEEIPVPPMTEERHGIGVIFKEQG